MKEKIKALIQELKNSEDFECEFYRTYIGELNDGDISEWHNTHFEDTVELGSSVGKTMAVYEFIETLESLLVGE